MSKVSSINTPTLFGRISCLVPAATALLLTFHSANASAQTGSAPTSCSVSGTSLTCTTTIPLSNVSGAVNSGALTLTGGSTQPPTGCTTASTSVCCNAVSPGTQTVTQPNAAGALAAACFGPITGYQWYTGATPASGALISGQTQSTYTPSTATVGTATYSVRALGANASFADSSAGATITVNPVVVVPPTSGGCVAGSAFAPRFVTPFNVSKNFAYTSIRGDDSAVIGVTVTAAMSTAGKTPTSMSITQDDTTQLSYRRVTVSQTCGDQSATATELAGFTDGGAFTFVTQDDPRANSYTVLRPGTWYINIKNLTCPAGVNCSISGIWRYWNF